MKNAILIFVLLLSACGASGKTELSASEARKDKAFSEFINPLVEKYQLVKLREKYLTGDDIEARIWLSASQTDGFVLKRITGKWSAVALNEIDCKKFGYFPKDKTYELGKINLPPPKAGWENAWQKLFEAGIFDLPGSEEPAQIEAVAYIVETSQNGRYKTFFYADPSLRKTEDARRMVKIGEIIADEFGLNNFRIDSLCLEK